MNHHLRRPCAAMLCCATLTMPASALAQQVYKCTLDGKVSYGDQPCPDGATATTLATPAAPPADPSAARAYQAMRKQAAALEKARLQRDAADDVAAGKAAKAATLQRRKCDKLRLAKQWADDDLRRAASTTPLAGHASRLDSARTKAGRAADSLALECGP
ncbi:MAG: DUF4124 domain-containing protein [Duganella sp.]